MDFYFIIVQAIGFLAFGLSLWSYQFKSQKVMFGINALTDAIWTVHYFFLNAYHVALTVLIAAIRTTLCVFVIPKYKVAIVALGIIIAWIICTFFYLQTNNVLDLLPAVTGIVYGLSTYFHEDYMKSRLLMVLGKILWIVIGCLSGSIAEIISSSMALGSIILGYVRHKKYLDNCE